MRKTPRFGFMNLKIPRFYGLDKKTNPIDVANGYSLDLKNVFQNKTGRDSKRPGNEVMFTSDEVASQEIDEVASANLSGTKYYFQFTNGKFEYSTSLTGAKTSISSAYTAGANQVWWTIMDNKVFYVDGTNALRFFDPSVNANAVFDSSVYVRPSVAPTSSGGAGFDYAYTVEKGYSTTVTSAESPSSSSTVAGSSAATITVTGNFGTATAAVNDRLRIYARANTTITSYKNVTPKSGAHANGVYETGADGSGYLRITSTAANYAIVTVAIADDQANLYSDLGVALNKSAPSGLTGITVHYGRLVAWKGHTVLNAKSTNSHSWPDDSAQHQAFQYTVGTGDELNVTRCLSYIESLYVFKSNQVFVFGGIGPDDTGNNAYSFRRLETNGIGCIAPKSAVVIGEMDQNYIVFLSDQGFYASNGSSPVRIGEKIETDIFDMTNADKQSAVAFHHKRDSAYMCFAGPANNRTCFFLDVRKGEQDLVGWFEFKDLPIKCAFWDSDRYIFGTYNGYSASERIAKTGLDYSDVKIEYVAAASVNTTTNVLTVTLSYATGDTVKVRTNGTIPAGLTANTTYYVISVTATTIKLATSLANALIGTGIDITTQGAGTHSVVGVKAINAYYTTNWINFGSTSIVKKLGKSSVSFDSTASSVNLTISLYYDWVNSIVDTIPLTITSSHAWGSGTWGSFVWSAGVVAVPKSLAIPRRKVRSIRYRFENNNLNEDFNLQALEMPFYGIRNRDNVS